jgi:hypothetical protein
VIIGGGAAGPGAAHDLALRGPGVRHHRAWFMTAMAVSAGRYVVMVPAMFGVI